MSSNTFDHKCPNCTAPLKFNPHGQNWVCEYCGSAFTKKEIDLYESKKGHVLKEETEAVKMEKDEHGMDIYTCPNCGAQIVADEQTTATFCVYCKNTAILKNKLVGEFNPSYMIPFYKTKEDAMEAFKKIGKGRPFMPKEFSNQKNIEEMRGIYIPFWLYDFAIQGVLEADAKRISSWTTGDYQYTKTDTYRAYREGIMSYHKIPVDGSTRFDDDMMNSIEPFDYKGLVEFSHSYLSGFYAEKYDVNSDQAKEDALKRASNSTAETLRDTVVGYSVVDVHHQDCQVHSFQDHYVLLPVWMLNIQYKGKLYMFAMNGQTGKIVGDIPIDKKKVMIWWAILFVAIFLLASLIWWIGGML